MLINFAIAVYYMLAHMGNAVGYQYTNDGHHRAFHK
jgi:hypothetical protein